MPWVSSSNVLSDALFTETSQTRPFSSVQDPLALAKFSGVFVPPRTTSELSGMAFGSPLPFDPPPPPPPPPPPADAGRIVGTLMFPRPRGVGIGRSCDAWRSTLQPELIGGLLGSPPLKPPAMASAPPAPPQALLTILRLSPL